MKFDRPTLVTITAPTCSGKNYLLNKVLEKFSWSKVVSTTTRAPRAGEVNGVDYHFITEEQSLDMEKNGQFAELVTFRGVRYGVTAEELFGKIESGIAPVVILEPQGVEIYKKLCAQNGYEIFMVYISLTESERIARLDRRTADDIQELEDNDHGWNTAHTAETQRMIDAVRVTHADRLQSIQTEERGWITQQIWDAIVPGDDADKALEMIAQGVQYRNQKNKAPAPYNHYA